MPTRRLKALVIYAQPPGFSTLSYQTSWPKELERSDLFQTTSLNLHDISLGDRLSTLFKVKLRKFDTIILLHSVFSNELLAPQRLKDLIASSDALKVYFIGNEYKLMPGKMKFCEDLGIHLLVSQFTSPEVHQLYRQRLNCQVCFLPSGGLDQQIFRPLRDPKNRTIDLGYRGTAMSSYLGHEDRTSIGEYFLENAARLGLKIDISTQPGDRFTPPKWNEFLNSCRGQLGVEGGSDFFELTDALREKVNTYETENQGTPFRELKKLFFDTYPNPIQGRCLSARHFEAAATRTVQILFRGNYDGYFIPSIHYIPLEKDFRNIDEVVSAFRDLSFCQRLIEAANDLVLSEFTYEKLIQKLHAQLLVMS